MDAIVGREEVEAAGGRVVRVELVPGRSTTRSSSASATLTVTSVERSRPPLRAPLASRRREPRCGRAAGSTSPASRVPPRSFVPLLLPGAARARGGAARAGRRARRPTTCARWPRRRGSPGAVLALPAPGPAPLPRPAPPRRRLRCAGRPRCSRRRRGRAARARGLARGPPAPEPGAPPARDPRPRSARRGRDDARDPARGARRGRLPPRGSGDRARPGRAPRRHPRRLPPRPRRRPSASSSSATPWRACAASTPRPSARWRPSTRSRRCPSPTSSRPRSVLASPASRGSASASRAAASSRAFLESLERGLLPEEPRGAAAPRARAHRRSLELPRPGGARSSSSPEAVARRGRGVLDASARGPRAPRRTSWPSRARGGPRVGARRFVARLGEAPAVARPRGGPRGARASTSRAGPVPRYAGDLRAAGRGPPRPPSGATRPASSATRAAPSASRDVLREDGLAVGEGAGRGAGGRALHAASSSRPRASRVLADGDIFPEEVHLHPAAAAAAARSFLSDFRDLKIGRPRRAPGPRHRPLRRASRRSRWRGPPASSWSSSTRAGTSSRSRSRPSTACRSTRARRGRAPLVDRLGSGNWEKVKKRVKKAMRDMAAELLKLYAERKARPGHAFAGREPVAARVRGGLRVRGDARPGRGHRRRGRGHGRRHRPWTASSAATWATARPRWRCARPCARCSTASRWRSSPPPPSSPSSTGRRSASASRPFPVKVEMVSRFRTPEGDQGRPRSAPRRAGRRPHRHPPPALQGRGLPRPRPPRDRRGAALRRGGQGEAQAPQDHRGLPHPLRHAHPAHPADGAGGHPRHVGHRDPAQGPAGHPDLDREVLDRRHRGRHPPGAGPRRPGLLRAQPRGVDLLAGQPGAAAGAGGAGGGGPRPDAGGGAREGHARLRGGPGGRARGHHHHRERPRHPARQHHDRQPRRPLRPRPALPAPRPGGPLRPRAPTPTCWCPPTPCSPRSRASAWPPSASSPSSGRASASPPSTSSCAAPATCSAASRAATSRRWASTST